MESSSEKNKTNVYKKHLSFTGFYSNTPDNVEIQTNRVKSLLGNLDISSLATAYADILLKVKEDLQAVESGRKYTFKITQNIADELAKYEDNQIVRYLYHRYRYDVYSNAYILDDYPPYVQIEPVSICNFRCVFCY